MRRGLGRGVAPAAAAAGACRRSPDRRPAALACRGAALFRQPCARGRAVLGAGDASGSVRAENDPCAALRNVAEAHPASRRHARFAESRRGRRAVFRRRGHRGGAVHLRHHQHGGRRLPHRFHSGGHCREEHGTCAGFARGAAALCAVHAPRAEKNARRAVGKPPRRCGGVRSGAGNAAQHPHHPCARAGALHGTPLRPPHRRELRRRGKDKFLRRDLFPRGAAAGRGGGGRRDAALRLRQGAGACAVRHVGRHLRCRHRLYFAHFLAHREPRHGDSDHPVGHGGREAHRRVSRPAGARRPAGAGGGCARRHRPFPCDLRLRRKARAARLLHDRP